MKTTRPPPGGQPIDPNAPPHPQPAPAPADLPGHYGRADPPATLVRVPFRDGFLLAAEGVYPEEGDRPIPLRPFADRLGLTLAPQLVKLKRVGWACVSIIDMQIPGDDQVRGVACLPLRALPMWLATINPGKVAPEARPMLESYQREAAEVLFRHFLAPVPPGLMPPAGGVAWLSAEVAELSARVALQGEQIVALRKALGQGQGPRRRRRRQRTPTGATSAALGEVVQAEVLTLVGLRPGLRGVREAQALLHRRKSAVSAAIRTLLAGQRLENRGRAQHPRLYLVPIASGEVRQAS